MTRDSRLMPLAMQSRCIKPFRLRARIQNNRLVRAREDIQLSQAEAARQIGTAPGLLGALENLKTSAMGTNGWRPIAVRIAAFYGYSPEYLWPEELAMVRQSTMLVEIDVADSVASLTPHREYEVAEMRASVASALAALPVAQAAVLKSRFGLGADDESLRDIGARYGLSGERIRQLESKALRKLNQGAAMRRGSVPNDLREHMDS